MDLIALAIPFFLLALALEIAYDLYQRTGYYRLNDAINSLSAGILSTTTGYFTRLLPLFVWGLVLQNFALIDMPLTLFDASIRGIALWILAAILWDFCYYWFHRYSHEMSVLWAAHAVHHQSEDYNLSTALRQTSTGFLFGWIFYLPLFLLGFPLEVLLAVNAINLIYQFWVHTQAVGRLGILDYILVTPSNHRVHHAQNARYIDRNYGGMFILWDRWFGTFADENDADRPVFGVRKPLASWNPLWANWQVYKDLWQDSRMTAKWSDKLKVWLGRTGWRPDDVQSRLPREPASLATFEKYDPTLPRNDRLYVMLQFAAAVVIALIVSARFAAGEPVLLHCLALWALLFTIGRFTDRHPQAFRLEVIRLVVLNPLLLAGLLWAGEDLQRGLLVSVFSYTALSVAGLFFYLKTITNARLLG